MRPHAAVTIADVRALSDDLTAALRRCGAHNAADTLENAVAAVGLDPPEALLELRSALVRTRSEWEGIDDVALIERSRATLAAAKRLALEL
ncbi:MAG TPA: hypothetical protein VLG28_05395 [Acidimicrobiia bacterium]|jgi:hypothetical protein|nr:hypothetical protein [Acidimicrobiia bacterium]